MKKIIKSFVYVLIMTSIATMVSGCSSKKAATSNYRSFVIWSFEDEDIWKPTIKTIQKSLGDQINVVYVKKTLDSNYENNAVNSILSGKGPDIWAIPNDWIFRHKDQLASMPDSIASNFDFDKEYVPAVKESCSFDGKTYAMSPYMDTLRIYYNAKMFEKTLSTYYETNDTIKRTDAEKEVYKKERARITNLLTTPPTIWSDFTAAVQLLTKRDGTTITQSGFAAGTSNNISNATDFLYALMLQNGTKMTSDDAKQASFNLPEASSTTATTSPAKRAVDFYSSFANPAAANYSWNSSMPKDVQAFTSGNAAMMIGYGSLQNYLEQNYPNFTYKTSVLPQIGDSQSNVIDYGSYYAFTVPSLSPFQQIAWNAISTISSTSDFPSTLNLSSSLKKKDFEARIADRSPDSGGINKQPQTAHTWNKGRYPVEIDNLFKSIIDKTNIEPANSQTFINNAALQTTELLKKSDW